MNEVGGRLDQAAANDKQITGVGLVLFWPALFFLGGTKQQEADFARLRGEYDAVQQAMIQKKCPASGAAADASTATSMTPAQAAPGSATPAAPVASQPGK